MATLAVHGGPLYTPFEVIEDGAVVARDGVVEWAGLRVEVEPGRTDVEVDARGRMICPGFVDLQVNGGGGAMLTSDPSSEALRRILRVHVQFGTTALLPTVVSADEPVTLRALEIVREACGAPPQGARALGSHLEGPFLSPARRGAHDPRRLQPPSTDLLGRFLDAAGGSLRLLTLAPELPGALDLIRAARAAAVRVSIGHSDATYEQAIAGIEAGASLGTHVFNAMSGLHQRAPGLAGALLEHDGVTAITIADGVHLHPAVLKLVARAKGAGRTALVTDAMPPAGTEATSFELLGRTIQVRDGACYTEDGTLAGSALTMNRAVRLMRDLAGVSLRESVEMATATPAAALGMYGEIGVLKAGARADIVICDEEINVWKVFVGGEIAYDAER